MSRYFAEQPVRFSRLPAFRAEHFPYAGPYPWLDRDDAEAEIQARRAAGRLTPEDEELCRYWARNGYVILRGLFEHATLDTVWNAYEDAIARGRLSPPPEKVSEDDPYPGRLLNPHKKVAAFCRILKHPELLRVIELLMEREPRALQTIAGHKGTQQGLHSDSIHMTTYPLGYLTAAWIAFEDIHADCGPLVYYPGSHRLPYVFSRDVGIGVDDLRKEGYTGYRDRYEPCIREMVEEYGLEPHHFHARKGDVLIWHANLIHGGSERRNLELSRKAVVAHFFVKGAFVYHDLAAQRSKQQYVGTCLLRDENAKFRLLGEKRRPQAERP